MPRITHAFVREIVDLIGADDLRNHSHRYEGLQICEHLSRKGIELTIAQVDPVWHLIDFILANMLTPEQHLALGKYASEHGSSHGRSWKEDLHDDWMSARQSGVLQQLRNASYFGPAGLLFYKLPKFAPGEIVEEVKTGKTYRVNQWDGKLFDVVGIDYDKFTQRRPNADGGTEEYQKSEDCVIAGTEKRVKPSEIKWKNAA